MKVLVVGGAGYIGSRLVPVLEKRGHDVTVVDLLWFGIPEGMSVTKIYCEDAGSLTSNFMAGVDAVIFLAGLSNDPMADFDPLQNFTANAALPAYLADQAKKAGVKAFIHGGSCSVYGLAMPNKKLSEVDPSLTTTPYGVSKLMGELGVNQQSNHMRTVLFRMGTVAGWSPRMRFDLVINAMVKSAMTKREITINDGAAQRPILDISDAVRAYVHAVEDDSVSGIINLASENTTVQEIAETVRSLIKTRSGVTVDLKNNHMKEIRSYAVSTRRAERLGFIFSSSVYQSASEVYAKAPSIKNPDDPIYYNIKTFMANRKQEPSLVA